MLIFLSNFTIREALSKWLTILESECSFGSLLNSQTVFDEIQISSGRVGVPALWAAGPAVRGSVMRGSCFMALRLSMTENDCAQGLFLCTKCKAGGFVQWFTALPALDSDVPRQLPLLSGLNPCIR